ncbi:MAG: peptidyl-prolyl cis-trans isomerase [Planctomycetota bacterium]
MKNLFFSSFFFLFACLLSAQQKNQIVAKVNHEIITIYEIEKKISKAVDAIKKSNISIEEKKEKIRFLWKKQLREMVEELITLQAAVKADIKVTGEDIGSSLKKEKARLGGEENLEQILSDEGITIDDFQRSLRNQLIIERLFYQEAGLEISKEKRPRYDNFVSPLELREFYKDHQIEFAKEEEVKIRQIVLYSDKKGDREKAKELGESILRQLKEGADFAALAKLYDDGPQAEKREGIWPVDEQGKWLLIKRGQGSVKKVVEDAAFALKSGEVTPLIPWPKGYFIIKVEEHQKAEIPSFEQVQKKIRFVIQQQKIAANIRKVSEELRKNSYIWPEDLFED